MRIYFDNCCYNRPFDDRTQNCIYEEANAVLSIMKRAEDNKDTVIGSSILEYEISLIRDEDRRNMVTAVYKSAVTEKVNLTDSVEECAAAICNHTNIRKKDALELASAQEGRADVFLTTDDRLIKMSQGSSLVTVRVLNPMDFLSELARDERTNQDSF